MRGNFFNVNSSALRLTSTAGFSSNWQSATVTGCWSTAPTINRAHAQLLTLAASQLPKPSFERYGETIAAMKLRTLNGKGQHLSLEQAIRICLQGSYGSRHRIEHDVRRQGQPIPEVKGVDSVFPYDE